MELEGIVTFCHSLTKQDSTTGIEEITSHFRSLRNSAAKGPSYQSLLGTQTDLLQFTKNLIEDVLTKESSEAADTLVCTGIQFLGNLIVQHPQNVVTVWALVEDKILRLCLESVNPKVRNFISMVLLNVLLQSEVETSELFKDDALQRIVELLVTSASGGSEFSLFVCERFLKDGTVSAIYAECNLEARIFLLETAHQMLIENQTQDVSPCLITQLKEVFKKKSDILLQTFRNSASLEPLEYSRIVEILGFCSGSDAYRETLQSDKSLLISTVFLLICFHQCGQSSEEGFKPLEDISALMPKTKATLEQNPTYCFKRDLVRLIANLSWKHKTNQDEIRTMEAIPVILECCCLDARNPFMSQWCILAIRNLCENNPENQKFIALLTEEAPVQSQVLEEMGFRIENKRICLK